MELTHTTSVPVVKTMSRRRRQILENIFWYAVLIFIAIGMVLPFLWIFLTSFKGPNDVIYSVPPQLIPHDPTFANYVRVWNQLPIAKFFANSIIVAGTTGAINVLF